MSGTGNTQTTGQDVLDPAIASVIATKLDIDNQAGRNWPILSHEEKAFCHEYVINGFDHRTAADKIGHSKGTGISIKRRPYVAAYIEFLLERMHHSNLVIKGFLDARLDDLYEMAIGEVEVPLVTGDGSSFTAKKFQGGLALSILQERGKINGVVKEGPKGGQVIVNIDLGRALGEKDAEGIVIEGKYTEDG